MEQRIQFCTTADGARIAYATVGEGPPIMKAANWLSHLEWDWQSPIWRHMLAEFARDHTFIRYDERGNGLSDWNCPDLSFNAWVEDLAAVVDAAGLDRFPLLGISQGGAVAIAYAVRYPEKVSHLILYGAYARGWAKRDSPEEIEQRQAQVTLVKVGWGKDNPAFRQLWTTLYAPDATPAQAQSFNDLQRISTSTQNAVRLLNEMGNIDVVDLLPKVKAPTLVLHCRDDAGVPFEEGRKLAASISGARFVPLNGKNHLLLEGDPTWASFVKEVRRFIGAEDTSALKQSTSARPAAPADQPALKRSDLPERYQIKSFLGVGGMGEVYLAEDTKLGRKVAIKTLPAEFTDDKERLRRFQHEARTASGLNHPNILTIHEMGGEGGVYFIAAEYVDGDTLRTRINLGRMKIEEALDVAQQTAFALTAAHGAGIIHRDIKPDNIMVRQDAIVKVLDFGLAKLLEDQAREIDMEAETQVLSLTEAGRVLGTPAYMSPEQARGMELDGRTDIWSLGVVLYEMLAGRPPFRGETKSHTVVSILETEPPPLTTFAPNTPDELQRIVRKALSKDRDNRYQTARDLMIDLRSLRRDLDIKSEMRRSSTGESETESVAVKGEIKTVAPVDETSIAEKRLTAEVKPPSHRPVPYWAIALIALAIVIVGLVIWSAYHSRATPVGAINSIAVLPFVNGNNDPNAEYLSDGMTESIINSLSELPQTKVLARTTAFRYKGKENDIQKVGSELGVDALLTGKVSQQGDTMMIQADLIRVSDGVELWGNRYSKKLADAFVVQNEIAKEISDALRLRLSSEEQKRVAKRSTNNGEAYQLYLKGRFYWNKRNGDALKKSIEYFNQAIEQDPAYALAYSGLADACGLIPGYGAGSPQEFGPQAKAAARKAVELDDTLAEAHTSLAEVLASYDWNWAEATKEFQRAIQLNPNYSTAHHWYSDGPLLAAGKFDDAIAEMKRAQELDPLSLIINAELGSTYLMARQYDKAIEQLRKTIEMDPTFYYAHWNLAEAYSLKGDFQNAFTEYQIAMRLVDDPSVLGFLGNAYALAGRKGDALKTIAQMKDIFQRRYVSGYSFAQVYAALGEKNEAFQWLEKSYQEHSPDIVMIKVDPTLDNLRSDPQYFDLVRRVNLQK